MDLPVWDWDGQDPAERGYKYNPKDFSDNPKTIELVGIIKHLMDDDQLGRFLLGDQFIDSKSILSAKSSTFVE
jgi:hypothetical protein